jgi:transcription termination/antitermination protein NusG
MSELKWYVIRCSSGWEKKVKKQFESEVENFGLSSRISQIVIPTHKEYYIKSGKKIARETNLFPGYVLLEADMCGEFSGILKNIQGALHFLGNKEGKAESLKESEVLRILGKLDDMKSNPDMMKIPFSIGENVIITEGAFANFNATVDEINEEKRRVTVGVKIFGRKTPLVLEFNHIRRED